LRGIHENRRCLKHLASIHSLGHITRDFSAECSEFVDKVVQVTNGRLGSMIPGQEEFVLDKWWRNRCETDICKVVVTIVDVGESIELWG